MDIDKQEEESLRLEGYVEQVECVVLVADLGSSEHFVEEIDLVLETGWDNNNLGRLLGHLHSFAVHRALVELYSDRKILVLAISVEEGELFVVHKVQMLRKVRGFVG